MEKLKVGKIYKLIDNTNGNIYIGSTILTLNKRLSVHKCKYKSYLNNKYTYVTSFEIIKNNDYRIEIIKYVIYKDKIELRQRERYYIENNDCINKNIPSRTLKEYYIDNKDYKKEYDKESSKIKIQCECGSLICRNQKQRHFRTKKHINFMNIK
jgi:hypothetical protein